MKDCIQDVCLKVLGEMAAAKVAKVPLSVNAIARRVADLAENMEIKLVNQINLAKYYSLQLDESTDISNMAILMVYAVVVIVQILSSVVPLAEMAGFTPFLLQLLALRLCTLLDLKHPPSSNQSSLSPPPLASFRSFLVLLAFYCHSL